MAEGSEVWNEPGQTFWDQAMEELGFGDDDLEEVTEDPFPFGGVYPNREAVYRKAWELRSAEQEF